jgi:hypothetical protein
MAREMTCGPLRVTSPTGVGSYKEGCASPTGVGSYKEAHAASNATCPPTTVARTRPGNS